MSVPRPTLPHWRELTSVFRFPPRPHDTQLLQRAHMLAAVHRVRAGKPARDAAFEAGRTALRRHIAEWIIEQTGVHPDAAAQCATVIDDMAAAHITAERLLQSNPPPSAERLHAAWSDVGYLAAHWADLVAEVVDGQPPVRRPLKCR
ncbi:hypothetical protein [Nocardia jiangsuensis]|uniref:DUF4254 domain-containing protein n=1 Tax=Nocardia jiangsuensis TaxID=1691563 RepID=A0ABV8E0D7_9NOCA